MISWYFMSSRMSNFIEDALSAMEDLIIIIIISYMLVSQDVCRNESNEYVGKPCRLTRRPLSNWDIKTHANKAFRDHLTASNIVSKCINLVPF